MRQPRPLLSISLFGHMWGHFPVPAETASSARRRGGPGWRLAPARMRLALDGRGPGGRLNVLLGKRIGCAIALASALGVGSPVAAFAAAYPRLESPARLRSEIDAAVAEAAERFDLPPHWIRAVMEVESRMNPRAVSPKGAMGLMQLMPLTWGGIRQTLGLGEDPFDVRANILAGASYLRDLRDRYGVMGMLAAYNAGPARYEAWLRSDRPLPAETRSYVAVLSAKLKLQGADRTNQTGVTLARPWTEAPLFIVQQSEVRTRADGSEPSAAAIADNPLFPRHGAGGRP
jgi:hypothetical protein